MKQLKLIAFSIIIWLLPFAVFAQQYSFRYLTVSQGLGSASVNHIFQDSKGYLWFATQGGGVSKFNGKTFTTYTKADGLINNDVTFIAEQPNGKIWVGTAHGASLFNGKTFENFSLKNGLTNGIVYNIYAESNDAIYFATSNNGLMFYNGKTFSRIKTAKEINLNEAFCMAKDKTGKIWVGAANGIYTLVQNQLQKFQLPQPLNEEMFFSCMNDKDQNLWFGSTGGAFIKIDAQQNVQQISLPEICQKDFIGSIAQDATGNMWLATDHGLLKYTHNQFKLYSEKEGLSVEMAQGVLCDYENNIWCGTLGGGVNVLSGEAFVNFNEKNGLLGKKVNAVEYDANSNYYYIGTGHGLYILNNSNNAISLVPATENLNIISFTFDKAQTLWLATLDGIYTVSKNKNSFTVNKIFAEIDGKKIVSPTTIFCDTKGYIWLATFGSGLFSIHNKNGKNVNLQYENISNNLLTVFEDSKGNIWVGSHDKGIGKITSNGFEYLKEATSQSSVWSIAEDNKGNIFWSTSEDGLQLYDGNKISAFTTFDQLISNHITAIAWDKKQQSLWVGSETGLQSLKFSANNTIEKIENFNEHIGFTPTGINQNGIYQDTLHNTILFGTVNGLWKFSSNDFSNIETPARLQLTGIRLFYQSTDWSAYSKKLSSFFQLPLNLTLPYNKNHLTFDIQALTTRNVQYVFKLEGQDNNWSLPTNNNEITFSNIEPGKSYVFMAKAIDNDGVYSNDIISFPFYIKPAWWNTWWFRLLAALFLIVLSITIVKTRERALKNRNKILENTVKERTHEISQQKELVEQTLTEKEKLLHEKEILLKEIHHRVKNNLQTISSILMLQSSGLKDDEAKKAIKESQSRVRSIALVHQKLYQNEGIEKVELNAFVKDLIVQIKSLFNQYKQPVDIHINIPETHLLIDIAIPLGLILNELLTNSYKYAFNDNNKAEIKIELHETEKNDITKKVEIIYRDSGKGYTFSVDKPTTLGLRLIHVLSKQIGATINYDNSNGSVYKFSFGLNI